MTICAAAGKASKNAAKQAGKGSFHIWIKTEWYSACHPEP